MTTINEPAPHNHKKQHSTVSKKKRLFPFHRTSEKNQEKAKKDKAKVVVEEVKPDKKKVKLSYKEQVEFDGLEDLIEKLSSELETVTTELNSGSLSGQEAGTKATRLNEIGREIQEKEARWLELAEYA